MKYISLPAAGRNKKAAFGIAGALVTLLLTAGAAFGVQGYNDETSHRCADAVTAAGPSATTAAAAQEKAAKARAFAVGAAGYTTSDGSAALLSGVDSAASDLGNLTAADCSTREQAAALAATTGTVASKAAVLNDAAVRLSDHVEAFRAAETKRIAAERKAAEEAAATKKKADNEAAAAKQAEEAAEAAARAAALQAARVQMAPVPAGVVPAPLRQAPAPAPAPLPAPAPVTPPTGGWTPPPPGQGGGHGCVQINDYKFCG